VWFGVHACLAGLEVGRVRLGDRVVVDGG